MAERYNFKYLPLVGKLPGKSMVEQTETAINELASVVYDNVGHVGNLAEEVQTANANASNALDKATEALETSSRVYIKQIAAVNVNDYYDSELYYINNDGSTNIPVRDRGFLEVKTNDDKTACEQVFIADSTGTPYYRHGRITEQTLGEETTYVVTWSGWSSQVQADWNVTDKTSEAFIKNKPLIKLSGSQNVSASLVINPTADWYNENIRMNESSKGWASIYIGGSLNSMGGPEEHAWCIFRNPTYDFGICPKDNKNVGKRGLYLPLSGRATLDGKTVILEGDTVGKATADAAGNNIQTTYAKKSDLSTAAPTGVVQAFAGSTTPQGWLLCDGSAVSRTDYAALFAVIGTTYGAGNGSTTFNLPNLVDKFIEGSATAGTKKTAGLPNIKNAKDTPSIASLAASVPVDDGDPLYVAGAGEGITWAGSNAARYFYLNFDASRSSSIYGNSTTVQPPALTMRYIIKY